VQQRPDAVSGNGGWPGLRHWLERLSSADWQRRIDALFQRDLVWGVVFVAFFSLLLFRHGSDADFSGLKPGDVAPFDIRVPFDIELPDERATEMRRQAERDKVVPVYDYNSAYLPDLTRRLREGFGRARGSLATAQRQAGAARRAQLLQSPPAPLVEALRRDLGLGIGDEALRVLIRVQFRPEAENALAEALASALRGQLTSDRELLARQPQIRVRDIASGQEWKEDNPALLPDLEMARLRLEQESRGFALGLDETAREVLQSFLGAFLSPTLTLNSSETERRREEAASMVVPLIRKVEKGRVLARQGEELGEEVVGVLRALMLQRDITSEIRHFGGTAILLILLVFFLWRYASFHTRSVRGVQNLFGMLVFVSLVMALVGAAGAWLADPLADTAPRFPYNDPRAYFYGIPVAAGAMLVTLLANARISMVYSIFFSVLFGMLMRWDFGLMLYSLVSHLAAIYGVTHYRQRTALIRAGMLVGLVNACAAFALGTVGEHPAQSRLLFDSLCALAGGFLVGVLVSFLLPLFESIFNVLTDVRLLELSNLNSPLLKRLALEAPGSYNHSVMVGTLAEAAAEALHLNPLFCRVAAYYHDIGKITKPEYFIENQRNGENRHDKVAPHLSALIISSHVKEGLRLGRENKLPQRILDIIPQHHGTRLMTYFYKKAKKAEDPDVAEVDETLYRYQGPKPQTKEAAIFMLADAMEAASRTLEDPTPQRLRDLMKRVANDIVLDGQLEQCDLTFTDLDRIIDAFVKTLVSIYHHRIEYPGYRIPMTRERLEEAADGAD
jgi:hypothetical protein